MSFKGTIQARCPKGCEPFETEVWSFIHGGNSSELREAVAAKECNLLLCPDCGVPFFADAPYVYFEPEADILVFVFPDSYRNEEPRWRRKMADDFQELRKVMGAKMPLEMEPEISFDPEDLARLLNEEDFRAEEREVMECVAAELGLSLYRVRPGFARRRGIPASLPYAPAHGGGPSRANIIAGLERLLAANDRLGAYRSFLKSLRAESRGELPPSREERRSAAGTARQGAASSSRQR